MIKTIKKSILILLWAAGLYFVGFVTHWLWDEHNQNNHHWATKGRTEQTGEAILITAHKTTHYKHGTDLELRIMGKENSPSLVYYGYFNNDNYKLLNIPAVWEAVKAEELQTTLPVSWVVLADATLLLTSINNKNNIGAKDNFLIPIILAWGLTGFIYFLVWCVYVWRFLRGMF